MAACTYNIFCTCFHNWFSCSTNECHKVISHTNYYNEFSLCAQSSRNMFNIDRIHLIEWWTKSFSIPFESHYTRQLTTKRALHLARLPFYLSKSKSFSIFLNHITKNPQLLLSSSLDETKWRNKVQFCLFLFVSRMMMQLDFVNFCVFVIHIP